MTLSPHFFIAIPLPQALKNEMELLQIDLKSELPYKQWTNIDDFHITLKFLGNSNAHQLDVLVNELKKIKQNLFQIQINGINYFGNPDSPRILYAAVEESMELHQLQQTVESCAAQCGFKFEKRQYTPHMTLAKKWNGNTADKGIVAESKKKYRYMQADFMIEKAGLYQIYPQQVPKYYLEQEFFLGGASDGAID